MIIMIESTLINTYKKITKTPELVSKRKNGRIYGKLT